MWSDVSRVEKAASGIVSQTLFSAAVVSSWREIAYATGDHLVDTLNAFDVVRDDAERAYLAWEIVMNVVELTEMVATVWLNRRSPETIPAHRASNTRIEKFWKSVVSGRVEADEIRAFLRLYGAYGFSATAQRTVRALGTVVNAVHDVLTSLATFWLDHAENARWFRHFPGSLTSDEAWLIDTDNVTAKAQLAAQLAEQKNVLEFIARMDGQNFEHTIIRNDDAKYAVRLGDAAIQLVLNWLYNSGIDRSQPDRQRHIFPLFTVGLNDDERRALVDGNYNLNIH